MMLSHWFLGGRAFAHSRPKKKLDSHVLSRVAMPGSQTKMSKRNFSERWCFFFRFQARFFLREELFRSGMSFRLVFFFLASKRWILSEWNFCSERAFSSWISMRPFEMDLWWSEVIRNPVSSMNSSWMSCKRTFSKTSGEWISCRTFVMMFSSCN